MIYGVGTPAKTLVFDVLVHQGLYPGQTPSLNVYRTVGVFNRGESNREMDRLDVLETIQPLGQGLPKFRSADTPAYLDMLRHICQQRQWDESQLRGYRCRVEYPIYSAELVTSFDVPSTA